MSVIQLSYLLFILALAVSLILDLGVLNRGHQEMKFSAAAKQYFMWFSVAIAYFVFLYLKLDKEDAILYLTAYFTEVSLSVDNLFVFVLIFGSLKIDKKYIGKVLSIGIILAIIFRIVFIFIGIALVHSYEWILALFGVFLVYTGIKMYFEKEEEEEDIREGKLYKFFRNYLRYTDADPKGKYVLELHGKKYVTILSLAVLLIGVSDLIFAVDSIPAVLSITTNKLVVYSSNIFAILGLRPLYFVIQKARDKFDYVQQGVSAVLVFIGIKILLHFIWKVEIPTFISFIVIIICLGISILVSQFYDKRKHV